MPLKNAIIERWATIKGWRPQKDKYWHYAFMIFSWACLLYACYRTWTVVYGRMYYLLDSDMSSELILSNLLSREHKLLTKDWFYSTELRVFNIHWAFTPLFFFFDNWLKVRQIGTAIVLLLMLASCAYFCWQAGIRQLFPLIAALLVTPVSDAYFRILLLTISYPPYVTATFFTLGLLLQYNKTPRRRTRVIQLAILTAFSVLLGTNGMRQLLILYLPLFLSAVLLAFWHSPAKSGDTLPKLDTEHCRLLIGSSAALAGAVIGYEINTRILRYIYHFQGQEGIQFTPFSFERLQDLIGGWLEIFGYQRTGYIMTVTTVYNAFCFLSVLIVVAAFISLFRRPDSYTLPEKLFYLLALFTQLLYLGLYFFTDMVYYPRYNIPVVILFMPVAVDYLYRLPRCRFWRGTFILIMAAVLFISSNDYYTKLWPQNMTASHEAAVASLRKAGYTEGYATFWNANIMVELSNGAFDIRVWKPAEVDDPDNLYEWLQATSHFDSHPEGSVFIFVHKDELNNELAGHSFTEGTVEYEDDSYIAYGYPSYDAMRTDFFY